MQLTLSHNDLTAALCEYLQARGMTAFDPSVVSVDFAFKRGTKELTAVLDTEPKPVVEAGVSDPKPASGATQTATTSASAAPAAGSAPAGAAEEPVKTAAVETPADTTGNAQAADPVAETAAAGGDDDNLFD